MAQLPQRLSLTQTQNQWAAILNPVIANPITQGLLLTDIPLTTGTNVINHKLGRKLIGWFIVGINAPATIFDTQATNQMSQLTLNLTTSADALVNIWVF